MISQHLTSDIRHQTPAPPPPIHFMHSMAKADYLPIGIAQEFVPFRNNAGTVMRGSGSYTHTHEEPGVSLGATVPVNRPDGWGRRVAEVELCAVWADCYTSPGGPPAVPAVPAVPTCRRYGDVGSSPWFHTCTSMQP